ncbi:hypothetical protein ACOZGD_37520 [Streptomyces murinus]
MKKPLPRTSPSGPASPRQAPRSLVLVILGIITLGVAALSVAVSYHIMEPKFGRWAIPTVGALDALWCVFQATEILAGNNRARVRRVQWAGFALTAVNAAIPTVDLAMRLHASGSGFNMAVVIAPVAIVATKGTWWVVLPALGRKVSDATRTEITERRQQVADRLEQMEADTADRIELLDLARDLNERVAEAETAYRLSVLKTQQTMISELHGQAQQTAATAAEMALPAMVAAIELPTPESFRPAAPALPNAASGTLTGEHRHTEGTQVSGLDDESGTGTGTPSRRGPHPVPLERLASVAGVPVPQPGVQLSDAQIGVVLRHLRYADVPPVSYRQARDGFRADGFVASEERIRRAWAALMTNEGHGEADTRTDDEDSEDADTGV